MKSFKLFNIYVQVVFYLLAGVNHYLSPEIYISMIPRWLPFPALLNVISGTAEIIAALLFAFPKTRWVGAWALIWTLVAVFPANFDMALNGPPPNFPMEPEPWMLWARLPFQILLIVWVYWLRFEGTFRKLE